MLRFLRSEVTSVCSLFSLVNSMGINRIVVNIIEHFPEMNSQGKKRPNDCKGINTCVTNIIGLFNGEHDANQRGWIPV